MTFGNNLSIREAGVYINKYVLSIPELIIFDTDNEVVYCARFVKVECNTFEMTKEMYVGAISTVLGCNAERGCLLVVYSDISLVMYSIPSNNRLSGALVDFITE